MNKYICLSIIFFLFACEKDEAEYFSLSCRSIVFEQKGEIREVRIETNVDWTISSNSFPWIVTNVKKSGENTIVYITVDTNNSEEIRSGYITFHSAHQHYVLSVTQKAKDVLRFSVMKEYQADCSATRLSIEIKQNIAYDLMIQEDARAWITQVSNQIVPFPGIPTSLLAVFEEGSDHLELDISENRENNERKAEVIIYNNDSFLSDTLHIIQQGRDSAFFSDGEYRQIQTSRYGNKVNIVLMGDGFTRNDFGVTGRYEKIMRQASDCFFSIEPYKSYRDFFNVYMVAAVSKEEGINENGTIGKVNNKFATTYGEGTEITCNDDLCWEYARRVREIDVDLPVTVIVVLNSTKYAGTTYLYGDGNSIALCPMSQEEPPNDFAGVIHHEAGGHGFGFLSDEYVYYNKNMPESEKQNIKEWQKNGFQMNLDFTNDLLKIRWKDFIGLEKYKTTGAYAGGAMYQSGVWRSEANSCMNNNVPYYNVQSRWSIVGRIMKISGRDFSILDFINSDYVAYPKNFSRSISDSKKPPLGSPNWIKSFSRIKN